MKKKMIAMLAAAMVVVAAAGCVNKDITDGASSSVTAEENGSVIKDENVTSGGTGNGGSTKFNNKITQYTTRKPSPSTLTKRPTTERITRPPTTKPIPTNKTTTKPTTTKSQSTTALPYTPPVVEYGGTFGTEKDSVRIKSHDVSLSQNNTFILTLKIDILVRSGTEEYVYIGCDCYDASGKKINDNTIRTIVSVKGGETQTIAITTVPSDTAKVVFKNM